MAVEHYAIIIAETLGYEVEYNPACFDFSEAEAREKKLWRSEKPMPTSETMETENAKIVTEQASTQYIRQRKSEYDALNQFELMTDDAANSTTTHADAISAIKTKYPKP